MIFSDSMSQKCHFITIKIIAKITTNKTLMTKPKKKKMNKNNNNKQNKYSSNRCGPR